MDRVFKRRVISSSKWRVGHPFQECSWFKFFMQSVTPVAVWVKMQVHTGIIFKISFLKDIGQDFWHHDIFVYRIGAQVSGNSAKWQLLVFCKYIGTNCVFTCCEAVLFRRAPLSSLGTWLEHAMTLFLGGVYQSCYCLGAKPPSKQVCLIEDGPGWKLLDPSGTIKIRMQ